MAFPNCSRSPLPALQTLWDYDLYIQGQVPPSPLRCLQKCSRKGASLLSHDSFQRHYKPVPKLELITTVVACIHGYGDPHRNSRDSVMGILIPGGIVSAVKVSGFGRVHGKLFDSSVFPASPNVGHGNPHAFDESSNLLNVHPHLGFTGGADDSGKGSGAGGEGGGYNRHNFGKGDNSGHHEDSVVLLGLQALFQGLNDGKISASKWVHDILSFLVSQWVSMTPYAYAQSSDYKDRLGNLLNGHALESDSRDWKSEDSIRREENQRMQAGGTTLDCGAHKEMNGLPPASSVNTILPGFEMNKDDSGISSTMAFMNQFSYITNAVGAAIANLHRQIPRVGSKLLMGNQEHIGTASVQVDNMHGYMTSSDQDDESSIEGYSFNRNWDMDNSCDMELRALQPASKTQAELKKQGVMGWLEQLLRPAFAKPVDSYESTSKKEVVEQQVSRVLSGEGGVKGLKVDSETRGKPPGAKQTDVDALKRLQREAFFELMKLREKLEKLEQVTQARQKLEQLGAVRTHLKGQIKAGTAFVVLEDDSSTHSRDSLERAGMQTGLDVKFTFETPLRENDVLITQVLSGQSSSVGGGRALGGPLSLGKLHYVAHVNDDLSFSFVPLGAEGHDVTEIVNVLQGQGLTTFSSKGPPLFSCCKGSALGATVSGSKFAFSLAQYLSGWGNDVSAIEFLSEEDPLCYSTLGQFLFQPSEGFVLSFCGLNRYWPTPPLPSSMALHWTEMGPLIFTRIKSEKANSAMALRGAKRGAQMSRLRPHWEAPDLECGPTVFESKGTGLLSLAVSSSLDLGENMNLSGWAQVERGGLVHGPDKGNFQWAFSLLAKTSGRGIEWGASIGRSQGDIWHMSSSSYEDYAGHNRVDLHGPQLHVEAFLKLSFGKDLKLQPGLLYVSDKSSHTPAFIVRSSWSL